MSALAASVAAAAAAAKPPVHERRPHEERVGAHAVEDPYFWLRDDSRKREEVLAAVEAENEYCKAVLAPTDPLQTALDAEFVAHLKEDDAEPPFAWGGGWLYARRTVKGKDYPVWTRARAADAAGLELVEPQVVLDVNVAAEGHDFFDVGALRPSPDHALLAYSVDTRGYETYDVVVQRVCAETGALEPVERLEGTSGSLAWGADATELYYMRLDHAHRPYQLVRHAVGTPQAEDRVVFEEPNEEFWMGFSRSLSGGYLFCRVATKTTAETRFVPLDRPGREPQLLEPRRDGVLYRAYHTGDHFWIVTNDGQVNFKLARAPVASPGREHWRDVPLGRAGDDTETVDSLVCLRDHVAVFGRRGGLTGVRLLPADAADAAALGAAAREVRFPEDLYTAEPGRNRSFDAKSVRLSYTSLVTPHSTVDLDAATAALRTLKVKEVPGYDASLYRQERVSVRSADGTVDIPVSLVYRPGARPETDAPTLLYGYGSYGVCIDPEFSFLRLPLLDRGVVFAIAHIRGGGEMGRPWYENGKWLAKRNTFDDFVTVAEHLIATGATSPARLAISGGSAGGLLMGAVLNARPELFRACYTRVPFVDVVMTMSDPSIPLTVAEYTEWGNPCEEKYYEYIKSYSPIDNVSAKAYPAILITAGVHDSRVAFWEPLKWVAKLRHERSNNDDSDNPILLLTRTSGHGGHSGRYKYIREKALEYGFILTYLGLAEAAPAK